MTNIRKKEFYAYCAGLFDGEGSIYISKVEGKKYQSEPSQLKRGNLGIYNALVVKITNTNLECLEFIKNRIGGNIWTYQEKRGINPKPQHTLHLRSDIGLRLLSKMIPYLIIKKEQVKLGIKFQLQMIEDRKRGGTGYKVSQEQLIWREKIRQKIKELNRAAAETNHEDSIMEK